MQDGRISTKESSSPVVASVPHYLRHLSKKTTFLLPQVVAGTSWLVGPWQCLRPSIPASPCDHKTHAHRCLARGPSSRGPMPVHADAVQDDLAPRLHLRNARVARHHGLNEALSTRGLHLLDAMHLVEVLRQRLQPGRLELRVVHVLRHGRLSQIHGALEGVGRLLLHILGPLDTTGQGTDALGLKHPIGEMLLHGPLDALHALRLSEGLQSRPPVAY
mmetsp:Transcript_35903/g.78627  ORF Transcript_35903/g.78627 Transcript_35903/m.78627 type:complete len:218 (+) Transcript_35903:145-798(+)